MPGANVGQDQRTFGPFQSDPLIKIIDLTVKVTNLLFHHLPGLQGHDDFFAPWKIKIHKREAFVVVSEDKSIDRFWGDISGSGQKVINRLAGKMGAANYKLISKINDEGVGCRRAPGNRKGSVDAVGDFFDFIAALAGHR